MNQRIESFYKMSEKLQDEERQRCECWTRVMGYYRPVDHFNPGKQAEFEERVPFEESKVCPQTSHIGD